MKNANQKNEKYMGYHGRNGDYVAIGSTKIHKSLPTGVYQLQMDSEGNVYFTSIETKHDKIIDLPSPEFDIVVGEINKFLLPSTKEKFKSLGFLYKRSALLHGVPGTGKTTIVNRIIQKVLEMGGIVIFDPPVIYLKNAYKVLNSVEPNRLVMVIFEEFDLYIENDESGLLSLLDGEIQKDNVIYIATTNFIHKIPPRILRPGRFSSVIEVKYPNREARKFYFKSKLGDVSSIENYVEKTDGLSIDDLREVILSVECLGYELGKVIKRIKENKKLAEKYTEDFD